jgi:hypothetical protein
MNTNLIVIDDFYSDPLSVRALAESSEYSEQGYYSKNSPGIESDDQFYTQQIVSKFEEVLQERIIVDVDRNAFGRFRLAFAKDARKTRIHFDNTKWSALVYLTLPEYCQGGTVFCRHKITGLDGPPSADSLAAMGYSSLRDFDFKVVAPDTLRPEAWETNCFVAMRFNRLILFRGSLLFHGSADLFGNSFQDGRLTQNFFFDTATVEDKCAQS